MTEAMTNEELYIIQKMGRKNPFKVPEYINFSNSQILLCSCQWFFVNDEKFSILLLFLLNNF